MVHPFLVRVLVKVFQSVGSSVFKAYKEHVKKHGHQQANPFSEFITKAFKQINIGATPMTEGEAFKILNVVEKDLDSKKVLDSYHILFKKNDPRIGGSFYLQSKIYNAKTFLMERYPPNTEEEYNKTNNINEEKAQPEEGGQSEKNQKKEDVSTQGKSDQKEASKAAASESSKPSDTNKKQ